MRGEGFTLIELTITVAIVGTLASIAVPQFANAIRKANEGTTLGNLGVLRSALSVYYADTEGRFPEDSLTSLTAGSKYLQSIPNKYTPPYHPAGNSVGGYPDFSAMTTAREDWFYIVDPSNSSYGAIVVNCVHTDLHGKTWSGY